MKSCNDEILYPIECVKNVKKEISENSEEVLLQNLKNKVQKEREEEKTIEVDMKSESLDDVEIDIKLEPVDDIEIDIKLEPIDNVEADIKLEPVDDVEANINLEPVDDVETDIRLEPGDTYMTHCRDMSTTIINFNIIKNEDSIDIIDEELKLGFNNSLVQVHGNKVPINVSKEEIKPKIVTPKDTSKLKVNNKREPKPKTSTKPKRRLQCHYCERTYLGKARIKSHMKLECKKNPNIDTNFSCQQCKVDFANKYTYKRHQFYFHTKKSCSICQKKFKSRKKLKDHLKEMPCRKSLAQESVCKKCGRKYKRKSELQRHEKNECGIEPKFSCAHCEHRTSQKMNLIKHLARAHNIPNQLKTIECTKCKRSYKNECSLRRHLRFECGQQAKFNCKLCSYVAKRNYSLKLHMNNVHDEDN